VPGACLPQPWRARRRIYRFRPDDAIRTEPKSYVLQNNVWLIADNANQERVVEPNRHDDFN